jgi:hypothetical protein
MDFVKLFRRVLDNLQKKKHNQHNVLKLESTVNFSKSLMGNNMRKSKCPMMNGPSLSGAAFF